MTKLHELLAVEKSLRGQADHARNSIVQETFGKKLHHFSEKRVTFQAATPEAELVVEEQQDLQTTVKSELDWLKPFLVKSIDAAYQVDIGNTTARASIVTDDGTVIAADVPATALLQLEKRVGEIQSVIHAIPTLDPAKGFREAADRGVGVYVAREVRATRTKRVKKALTLAPATDKHPAQVQLIEEDEPVGTIQKQEWSGLITPSAKSDLLNRCEELARAIKQARSRANEIEIDTAVNRIGKKLLSQIFG